MLIVHMTCLHEHFVNPLELFDRSVYTRRLLRNIDLNDFGIIDLARVSNIDTDNKILCVVSREGAVKVNVV